MRRVILFGLSGLLGCLLLSTAVLAGSRNPADFPLRVHIFSHNSVSHYYDRSLNTVDGEGRANLYEDGQPHAFDYSYQCEARLMNSVGYDTYLARWKKPGKTLEILQPISGKTCELKVALKPDLAYIKRNGAVNEVAASVFKQWMEKHEYDPEHDKNMPVKIEPATTGAK
jgi:hypothetical protein